MSCRELDQIMFRTNYQNLIVKHIKTDDKKVKLLRLNDKLSERNPKTPDVPRQEETDTK